MKDIWGFAFIVLECLDVVKGALSPS